MNEIKDKILGFLYGCAIGDAFGMPGEMWEPDKISSHYGWIDHFIDSSADNEISGGFKAGETTDDTIVALISSKMLVETNGNPNPLEIVHRIEQWSLDNPKSKTIIGPSTRRAFDAIKEGKSVEETGINGITNGAGTRVAPIGIVCCSKKLEDLTDKAIKVCMATHNTNVAIAGAVAVASAVAHGFEGGRLADIGECVFDAATYGQKFGNHVSDISMSEQIKKSFKLSDSTVDDRDYIKKQYSEIGSGLPMIEAAPSAISIARRCNGDILRCAQMCANMGGDTDTVAAMSCSIVGAHIGLSQIPEDLVKKVQSTNNYDFDRLAEQLLQLRSNTLEAK